MAALDYPGAIRETYIERPISWWDGETGYTGMVGGTPDVLVPDARLIVDYKTHAYIRKDFEIPERHIAQLSTYRWIAATGRDFTRGELVYITMSKVHRFPVRLWSLKRTEEWIKSHLPALMQAYHGDTLPAPLTDPDEKWRCDGCEVDGICSELWEEGA